MTPRQLVHVVWARARDERGSVVFFVAIGLMAMITFFAVVIDAGNWYFHKRALQNQTDAAVLAGAAYFGKCFVGDGSAAFPAMTAEAAKYSGAPAVTPQYNAQVGGDTKGTLWIDYNSLFYKSNPGAVTFATDRFPPPAGVCGPDYIFDVKETDSGIPLIMRGFLPGWGNLAHISARARVQLKQEIISGGSLPLAVSNVNPNTVTATFVDEATGKALTGCSIASCVFPLAKGGAAGTLQMWGGDATIPAPTAAGQKIGVRVGLANQGQGCAGVDGGDGFICMDNTDNNMGLITLRGVNSAAGATGSPPVLNAVWPSTLCSGSPFFSDYSITGGSCGAGLQAKIDFGTGAVDPTLPDCTGKPPPSPCGGVGATVTATVNGTPSPLNYDKTTGLWSTPGDPWGLPSDLGALKVSMSWTVNSPRNDKGNFTDPAGYAQILFSGSAVASDPVKVMSVSESGAANPGAPYSLGAGTHTLHVTVGLSGSLQLSTSIQLLRNVGGSRTTAVRCYPGGGTSAFISAMINGCPNQFQLNDWQAGDPDPGLCIGSAPATADPTPPPGVPDCIALEPGDFGNPASNALDTRYTNNKTMSCHDYAPYRYPNFDAATDPRVVQLMVTDFSYLSGSGKSAVPVVDFAEFYIAGWGKTSACGSENVPFPFSGVTEKPGMIWGYFIKTAIDNPGTGSHFQCDPARITPCVPVMVR